MIALDNLAGVPIFLRWKLELNEKGAPTKVPYCARRDAQASHTRPRDWGTLAEARASLERWGGDGLGIVASAVDDQHVHPCLDVDGCYPTGSDQRRAWVDPVAAILNGCYRERSWSGTGEHFHFLVRREVAARRRWRINAKRPSAAGMKDHGFELAVSLDGGYYLTCTRKGEGALRVVEEPELEALHDCIAAFRPKSRKRHKARTGQASPDPDSHARTLAAIAALDNDGRFADRDAWIVIGMAAHDGTGGSDAGLRAWTAWTERLHADAENACSRAWATFTPGGGTTVATLFKFAREDGYELRRHHNGHDHTPGGAVTPQAVDPLSLEDDGRSIAAVMDILRNEDTWRGVLAYDRFSMLVMLMKPMPRTGPQLPAAQWTPRPMRDVDTTNALAWFHELEMKKLTLNTLYSAMVAVAQDDAFHPVLDYFNRVCAGDAPAEVPSKINAHRINPRLPKADALSRWLVLGFGAEDTVLNRAFGRAFMISLVRRVCHPGCQQDHMLVLMSDEQGLHKSRGLRALIGDDWFADRLPAIASKDALIQLHGKILIERPEVETLTDADKAFLSSSIDRFRAPYGRIAEDHPRTCSFAGTTNHPHFLDDASGGRRYWPVEVTGGDRAWLADNRDLIWRQACLAESAGEVAWLDAKDLQTLVRIEQEAIQRPDPWHENIVDKAEGVARANEDIGARWQGLAVNSVFLHSVFGNLSSEKMTPKELERATKCLRRAGWRRGPGRRRKRWFPPSFEHEPEER